MLPVFPDFAFCSNDRGTGEVSRIPEWNAVASGCKTAQDIQSPQPSYRHVWRSECPALFRS